MPVQRRPKLAVTEADKGAGEATAGAGQAGELIKRAKSGNVGQPSVRAGQRQQAGSEQDSGKRQKSVASAFGYGIFFRYGIGGRG